MWRFCFTRIRLNPSSSSILYHDRVSMIVPWFTSFVEDFVICCYQVSKLFCPKYCFANELLARSPCYFVSQADIAISVFWEVSKNTVLLRFRCRCLRIDLILENSVRVHAILFLSEFLCFNQSGRSANGYLESFLSLFFLFWFWISGNGTSALVPSSSLRSETELEDEFEAGCTSSLGACTASFLSESCGSDAEGDLLSGTVESLGTFLIAEPLKRVSVVFAKLAERKDCRRFIQ